MNRVTSGEEASGAQPVQRQGGGSLPGPRCCCPGGKEREGSCSLGRGGSEGPPPPPSNTETQGRFVERSSVKGCILEKSLWMPGAKGQEGGLPTPGEGCWGRGSVLGTFGKCDMKESQE